MITDAEEDARKDHTDERKENGSFIRWKSLFNFTTRSHVPVLLLAISCSVAAAFLLPMMAIFFGSFFNVFSDFASSQIDGEKFMHDSLLRLYGLFAVGVATFLFNGALFCLWLMFGELQAREVREMLFQSLLDRDIEWYEARITGVGTLLTRIQSQIRDFQLGTSQHLGLAIVCLVQAFVGLALALRTNWKLTLVIISAIPVMAIGAGLISRRFQAHLDGQHEALTTATKLASNCITNIVTVKCFNTQEMETDTYNTSIRAAAFFAFKQAFVSAMQLGFTRFATTAMLVQGFWYGGTQVHSGTTAGGDVITTFWGCVIAAKAFEGLLPHIIIIQKSQTAAIALKAIVLKANKGKSQVRKVDGLHPQFCDGYIEMREISFAYPSRPQPLALKNCNFYFPAGEMTFIVGKSGSGKSTLSNLLMRFYRPQIGSIVIDDNEIQDIDTSWLRNNITLVQQQCILFSDTIATNIALGKGDTYPVTDAHMDQCIQMAALESTILQLPAGIQTRVGAGGSSLSGGQKQRIAIARARLRDTPILILDEATSALDNTSKVFVMDSIREWRRGKTTIIITHDLSQIQDDDFVYVLTDGCITQEGRRATLASSQGGLFGSKLDVKREGIESSYLENCAEKTELPSQTRGLSSHPVRKDSFDFLTKPYTEDSMFEEDQGPRRTTQTQNRIRNGISISSTAALKALKRQSMARAKVMYEQHQSLMYQPNPKNTSAPRRTLKEAAVAARKSIFLPRMPRTPLFRDKPLPIPPQHYEMLRETMHVNDRSLILDEPDTPSDSPTSIPNVLLALWRSLSNAERRKLVLGFLATVGHAATPPALAYGLVQVFNTYNLPTGYQRKVLTWSIMVLGVAVSDAVASFSMQYFLESTSQRWIDSMRIEALQRILQQPKSWFDEEDNNTAALMSSLDKNAEEIKDLVAKFAAQILTVAVMVAITVVWSLITCWKLTIVSIAGSPVLILLAKAFEVVSTRWGSRTSAAGDAINLVLAESFTDIKTVRSLTLESYFHRKYHDATRQAFSVGRKRAIYTGFFLGLSESAIAFFTPMILWYGAYLTKLGQCSATSVSTVFGLLLFCTANASAVMAYIPQTSLAVETAARLIRLARMPTDSHEGVGHVKLDRDDPTTLSGPIHFINLTFSYPSRPETPALCRVNLTIPAGQTTAIVGASGSGKSTITSLLLGLYPPSSSPITSAVMPFSDSITVDSPPTLTLSGRDIRTLDLRTLRSLIAIVPQTPVLLPGTVRDNITYGLDATSPLATSSAITAAAQQAGIHDFIVSLPQGYATVLGDGGLFVSGGQAQRIVIARALVRRPRILILDEATSALDVESAELIRRSVKRIIEGGREKRKMTVIVVTHAREMMEFADHVVVMEEGSVVEQGGFEELMRLQGRGRLWALLNTGVGSKDGDGG